MNTDIPTQPAAALPTDQKKTVGVPVSGLHAKAKWSTKLPKKKAHPQNAQKEPTRGEINSLIALYGQGRVTAAETLARSLSVRFPQHGFGWKVLGAVLQAQGRTAEAFICCQEAANLMPQDAEALGNLAALLEEQNRLTEAAACLQQAVALAPGDASGHLALASIQRSQGQLNQAVINLRRALALDPNYVRAHLVLGVTLEDLGRTTEAITCYRHALRIEPDHANAFHSLLFSLSHDLWTDPQQLFAAHLAFGEQFEAPLRAGWQGHSNIKDPARCLQVGFVSGDLNAHAVARFLEPALVFLAKKQSLSLHAYYTHTLEDTMTQRLHTYFSHWHAVADLSDAELAKKIRADGIDILIDLSGHTAHNRLLTFARKPAPIQVSWMGYPGTTGLQAMDYYLCDRFWIPPGELDWQFTEKPAYLPIAVVFQSNVHAPAVNTLPALENGFITFGSFNRLSKINESVIVLWSMLLSSIPNARMLLGGISLESQDALIQSFAHEGIAQNRLIFYPRSNMPDYLALHHQIDICLDTFPYGGGTTTLHAAWMAVPTLTMVGETPPSRAGLFILNQLGLDGFIANNIEDFVSKGCYWANHIEDLSRIRFELRMRFTASALGQPETFADSFEGILRTMWQRWCCDLPPEPIEVTATEMITVTRPNKDGNNQSQPRAS